MKKVKILVVCGIVAMCNFFTGFALTDEPNETTYCGSGGMTQESETISYSRKETTEYSMKGDVPDYSATANSSNCANVAGSVLIGYYDRFCENLIPNYKTYVQIGSAIKYKGMTAETEQVAIALYSLMGTAENNGTTYSGFHTGMNSYVTSHGYTYNYEEVGNLNFDKYKTAVENSKPVALFLATYSLLDDLQDNGTSEVIISSKCTVAHVSIACGYRIDTYYDASGKIITTRTYLKAACGDVVYGIGYVCLDGKSILDKAVAVTIS